MRADRSNTVKANLIFKISQAETIHCQRLMTLIFEPNLLILREASIVFHKTRRWKCSCCKDFDSLVQAALKKNCAQ